MQNFPCPRHEGVYGEKRYTSAYS